MSHKTHKYFSLNTSDNMNYFNLIIPRGAITGRFTSTIHGKKQTIIYCITDFRYHLMSDEPQFNIYLLDDRNKNNPQWHYINTARLAITRELAQMLYYNLSKHNMLGLHLKRPTSYERDKQIRENARDIKYITPKFRRVNYNFK